MQCCSCVGGKSWHKDVLGGVGGEGWSGRCVSRAAQQVERELVVSMQGEDGRVQRWKAGGSGALRRWTPAAVLSVLPVLHLHI